MLVGLEGEEEKEGGQNNNVGENMTQRHETVSLKFSQARDCLAELEDDLFSFVICRPQENTSTRFYGNKTYNIVSNGRFL